MNQVEQIIEVAKRYVGIKEQPPNSNKVIFNERFWGILASYAGLPWCCAFIWCLFQDIGAPELFYGGGKTASCGELMNFGKKHSQWYPGPYKVGDLAIFDWSGKKTNTNHIGLIISVEATFVTTIEGNTSVTSQDNGGSVMERKRANELITGVYRPKYKEEEDVAFTYEEFKQFMAKLEEEKGEQKPAEWSREDREWAELKKLIQGDENGKMKYKQDVTREQMVIFMHRLYNLISGGA